MLPLERQNNLIKFLEENNSSTVSELAMYFNVHEATIRRDLTMLEKKGVTKRTHGGAILNKEIHSEPSFQERESVQYEEKRRIGKKASSIIEDGDNIILDSGTTTLHIAKSIVNRKNITVVTNDINIAAILRFSPSIKVVVTGGVLFTDNYILNGYFTNEMLSSINVQKAFIGTPALHHKKGITHFDEYLVAAKREMIRAAKRVVIAADHTKIGRVSTYSVAETNKINDIVIGKELHKQDVEKWERSGVKVLLS